MTTQIGPAVGLADQLLSLRVAVAHAATAMMLKSSPLPARVVAARRHLQGVYEDLCDLTSTVVPHRARTYTSEADIVASLNAAEDRLRVAVLGVRRGGDALAQRAEALDLLAGMDEALLSLIEPELSEMGKVLQMRRGV